MSSTCSPCQGSLAANSTALQPLNGGQIPSGARAGTCVCVGAVQYVCVGTLCGGARPGAHWPAWGWACLGHLSTGLPGGRAAQAGTSAIPPLLDRMRQPLGILHCAAGDQGCC